MIGSAQAKDFTTIRAEHVASLLKNPAVVVIDVRTPEEHRRGRIAQREIKIDYFGIKDLEGTLFALDDTKMYIVYCHDGRRSKRVAEIMASFGFTVFQLEGGIKAYYQRFPRRIFDFKGPPEPPPQS